MRIVESSLLSVECNKLLLEMQGLGRAKEIQTKLITLLPPTL